MRTKAGGLIGGLTIGALTAATFALGVHLGPKRPIGHNLFHAQASLASRSPLAGGVIFASTPRSHTLIADNAGKVPAEQNPAPEDFTEDGPAATFQDVYVLLKRNFVEGVPDDSKLGHGAAAAMLASLRDPASRFFEPAQMAEMKAESQGVYHGLGAVTFVRKIVHAKAAGDLTNTQDTPDSQGNVEYRLTVVAPLPGSPAEKAGLKTGDVITDINGQWIASYDLVAAQAKALKAAQDSNDPVAITKIVNALQKKLDTALTLSQAGDKLTDPAAKSLTLTVSRPGEPKPLTLTLDTSAPTTVTPVVGRMLPGGIGYIKITQFTDGAEKAFDETLTGFGPDLKGLIVDLRDSPGGLLDVGSAIAARLSTARSLGILQMRGKRETPLTLTPGRSLTCPVEALVNGGTANTAELLAATLRDSGGKLIGTTTFGDATDVKPIALRDGSGFTMTIGQLFTAGHGRFADVGIKPDVVVPDAAGVDAPLNRAIGLLSGRVARVPSDRG